MPNKWIEHVKAFASKNNLSYGCAISKPECKSSYQKAPKPPGKSRKMKSSSMVGINPTEVYSSPPRVTFSTPEFATQPSKIPKPQKGAKSPNPEITPTTLFPKKAPKAKAPKAKAPKGIKRGEKGFKKFIIESP